MERPQQQQQQQQQQTICVGCSKTSDFSLAEKLSEVLRTQQAVPPSLCAQNKSSFAYKTIKDRLPDILGKTIDFVESNKREIHKFRHVTEEEPGSEAEIEEVAADAQRVSDDLKGLKREIENNTPARPLERLSLGPELDHYNDDVAIWNGTLEANRHEDGQMPRCYETSWLLAESYVYRRITESLLMTKHLRKFDPFVEQKRAACRSALKQMVIVSNHLKRVERTILESADLVHPHEMEEFILFMQLALWANKCDLSLSGMSAADVQSNELLTNVRESLKALNENILCDNTQRLWARFQTIKKQVKQQTDKGAPVYIDLVADNSGYEIFVDMCLVHCLTLMLVPKSLEAGNVRFRFHLKRMPWFVSDTMRVDVDWLLRYMSEQGSLLAEVAQKWRSFLESGLWQIHDHRFWTLPHEFTDMPRVAKDLYATLQGSSLIVFKGDLNYRKLTGDRSWHALTPFRVALRDFTPAPLVALRTLKADTVVGIDKPEVYARIVNKQLPENWLISGEYGLIQFFEPNTA